MRLWVPLGTSLVSKQHLDSCRCCDCTKLPADPQQIMDVSAAFSGCVASWHLLANASNCDCVRVLAHARRVVLKSVCQACVPTLLQRSKATKTIEANWVVCKLLLGQESVKPVKMVCDDSTTVIARLGTFLYTRIRGWFLDFRAMQNDGGSLW